MSELEVNVTLEEQSAYLTQKYAVDGPNGGVSWTLRMTENQQDDLKDRIVKKIEKREEYKSLMVKEISAKLKHKVSPITQVEPRHFEGMDQVIEAFLEAMHKTMELDKVVTEQQQLL